MSFNSTWLNAPPFPGLTAWALLTTTSFPLYSNTLPTRTWFPLITAKCRLAWCRTATTGRGVEACRGRTEGKKAPRGAALAVLQQARKTFMIAVVRGLCRVGCVGVSAFVVVWQPAASTLLLLVTSRLSATNAEQTAAQFAGSFRLLNKC